MPVPRAARSPKNEVCLHPTRASERRTSSRRTGRTGSRIPCSSPASSQRRRGIGKRRIVERQRAESQRCPKASLNRHLSQSTWKEHGTCSAGASLSRQRQEPRRCSSVCDTATKHHPPIFRASPTPTPRAAKPYPPGARYYSLNLRNRRNPQEPTHGRSHHALALPQEHDRCRLTSAL